MQTATATALANSLAAVKAEKKVLYKPKDREGFKGVFKCGKKFKAQIQINKVRHYLGLFDTEKKAAEAYDAYAQKVLGQRAKLNMTKNTIEHFPTAGARNTAHSTAMGAYFPPGSYVVDGRMQGAMFASPQGPVMGQHGVCYQVIPHPYPFPYQGYAQYAMGPMGNEPAMHSSTHAAGAPSDAATGNYTGHEGQVKLEPGTSGGGQGSLSVQEHMRYYDQYQSAHPYAVHAPAGAAQPFMSPAGMPLAYHGYPPMAYYPAPHGSPQMAMLPAHTMAYVPGNELFGSQEAPPQYEAAGFYPSGEAHPDDHAETAPAGESGAQAPVAAATANPM